MKKEEFLKEIADILNKDKNRYNVIIGLYYDVSAMLVNIVYANSTNVSQEKIDRITSQLASRVMETVRDFSAEMLQIEGRLN